MTGLDCNILVQLALAEHPANEKTVAALQAEVVAGSRLVFPPLIASEFLHVTTDVRRFSPPLTMTEAVDWLEDFISNPMVSLIQPSDESMHQRLRWIKEFQLGRKRILDTHLAAVIHTSGVSRLITSNPSDFTVFSVLEIISP